MTQALPLCSEFLLCIRVAHLYRDTYLLRAIRLRFYKSEVIFCVSLDRGVSYLLSEIVGELR